MYNVDFLNILLFVYANNDLLEYSTDVIHYVLQYYHNIQTTCVLIVSCKNF